MQYAKHTTVPVVKSRAEIEGLLTRYGASRFAYATSDAEAMIGFEANGRLVRFNVPLPDRRDKSFWRSPARGAKRSEAQAFAAWEQACRQRWRALALVIKAKLEAVETGITTFEDEFLAHIVLPNDQTVGAWLAPQLDEAYQQRGMPRLLLTGPSGGG